MCMKEGGKAVAGKCKWKMKVINQMGSKGEKGNAAGRICCWMLRGRARAWFWQWVVLYQGLACQDGKSQ